MKCRQFAIVLASLCIKSACSEEVGTVESGYPRKKSLQRFRRRLAGETPGTVVYQQGDVCPTMNNEKVPPDNSSCWQWEKYTGEAYTNPQIGCDYQPCQDAVCGCDTYCCDTAWDLSCRGYSSNSVSPINFFEFGCTANTFCCEPETASPKAVNEAAEAGVCVKNSDNPDYDTLIRFDDDVKFYYKVIEHDSKPALKVRIDYDYLGWLSWGMSADGDMVGSDAVIAIPDNELSASNPGRYHMTGFSSDDIHESPGEPLPQVSLEQSDTTTTLEFIKYLETDGDIPIDPNGTNTFLLATGLFNVFGKHKKRAHFDVDLSKDCIDYNQAYYWLSDPNRQSSDDKI